MPAFTDTICAPATASGGAISIIRVSGPDALDIVDGIFVPACGNSTGSPSAGRGTISSAKGYSMHYGSICVPAGETGAPDNETDGAAASCPRYRTIDEVLVSVFRAPHSYTGENSAEISCHGSSYIVQEILAQLTRNGAKMAAPGEFTQRAFINGRMDLSQAEAVADLIASQTAAAHRVAISQLKGGFSDELASMREQLLHIVALMELELDFSEEDVEFADRSELRTLLGRVCTHIGGLISSFSLGNAIKNGVPVAIVGATNAGKSTLLNTIIGENRAIVSDIAGTTRDTIEETYNLDGVLFRFIDTAGLRRSDDTIERIGIERAYQKLTGASLVLAVLDLTSPMEDISASASDIISKISETQKLIFILNKADAASDEKADSAMRQLATLRDGTPAFPVSAKQKLGIPALLQYVAGLYKTLDAGSETTLVTNQRHLQALTSALDALTRAKEGLGADPASAASASGTTTVAPTAASGTPVAPISGAQLPTDLLAQDIREALYHLGSITGQITTDEVLGEIFGKFCIGK